MLTKDELLAHKNNQEMCDYIKAKSLKFLSLDGLYLALTGEKETQITLNLATIISQEITQLNLMTI